MLIGFCEVMKLAIRPTDRTYIRHLIADTVFINFDLIYGAVECDK